MTVPIMCRGKLILYTQNRLFDILHTSIINDLKDSNLTITPNIQDLLDKTDQSIYGPGGVIADISDYLTSKKDTLLFAELVKKAIEREKYAFFEVNQGLANMYNFYEEILKYANTLP